jgi:hypothetical protein
MAAAIFCVAREHIRSRRHGLPPSAALPLFGHSPAWLATSALVFGVSFFAVVGSTTALVRFNYPPAAWPAAIAAMTIRAKMRSSPSAAINCR